MDATNLSIAISLEINWRKDMDNLNVAEVVSGLEDAGIYQRPGEMRKMLTGTESMRDTDPRISYYWGWLECLETQELKNNVA